MPGEGDSHIGFDAPRINQLVELCPSLIGRESITTEALLHLASLPRFKCLGVSSALSVRVRTMHKQPSLQLADGGSTFGTAQF